MSETCIRRLVIDREVLTGTIGFNCTFVVALGRVPLTTEMRVYIFRGSALYRRYFSLPVIILNLIYEGKE